NFVQLRIAKVNLVTGTQDSSTCNGHDFTRNQQGKFAFSIREKPEQRKGPWPRWRRPPIAI
ncbi:MAG: hypothetical protein MZV64_20880, partial [Ignavibacteriales bacterium]|nr:hypothetical protein [Ignavibacteriales bacterium]